MFPVGRKMKAGIPADWSWFIIPGAPATPGTMQRVFTLNPTPGVKAGRTT